MSDGDTRKVNEKALKDPNAQWVPLEKFKGFSKSDQIWVLVGLAVLIIILNVAFGTGGGPSTPAISPG